MRAIAAVIVVASLLAGAAAQAGFQTDFAWQAPAALEGAGSVAVVESGCEYRAARPPAAIAGTAWGAGIALRSTILDFHGSPLADRRLAAVQFPIQASRPVGRSQTRLLFRLAPGLHTDFRDVDRNDLRISGLALALYPCTPTLQAGAGLALTDRTGFYGLMPAAGIRWNATDRLELDLFLPRPKIRYAPGGAWSVMLTAAPAGGSWNIGRGTADDPGRELHLEGIQAALGVDWKIRPGIDLTVSAGGLFNRALKVDGTRQGAFRLRQELDDAPFAAVSLQIAAPGQHRPARGAAIP